jgi:hypothetical protein
MSSANASGHSAALDAATSGERTKYKAIVQHMREQVSGALKKPIELDDAKVASLAAIAKINKLKPSQLDRRFPNQNQLNNCWTAFNEYQLCVDKRGKGDLVCLQRGRDYSTVCPEKWVQDFKDQHDAGISMTLGSAFLKD